MPGPWAQPGWFLHGAVFRCRLEQEGRDRRGVMGRCTEQLGKQHRETLEGGTSLPELK